MKFCLHLHYYAISLMLLFVSEAGSATIYMTQKEFLAQAFSTTKTSPPTAKVLWLNDSLQEQIAKLLGHPYPKLRLRYWQSANQTVWFLDEIGKERPISFAIKIIGNRVSQVKVLAFRESRGGEIRFQGFTQQFDNIGLNADMHLSESIDGISGATMSVDAMKNVTRMALMLASIVAQ